MTFNIELANFWVGIASSIITLLAVIVALFSQRYWNEKDKPKIDVE